MSKHIANCFWLMLPPLAISGLLGGALPPVYQPDVFWLDIPAIIGWPETLFRLLVTGLPLLLPLGMAAPRQRWGIGIYASGVLAYGLAWWPLIAAPQSGWSTSLIGFAAPAYTPLLWLVGIGLVGITGATGRRRWVALSYAASAAIFLVCHNLHTLLIWQRHFPS